MAHSTQAVTVNVTVSHIFLLVHSSLLAAKRRGVSRLAVTPAGARDHVLDVG
jgi:hypothetical protein